MLLTILALAVSLVAAPALWELWTALTDPSVAHWTAAIAAAARSVAAVMLAILALRVAERPPPMPLWLPDWRALRAIGRIAQLRVSGDR